MYVYPGPRMPKLSETIQNYVLMSYVQPARTRGQETIRINAGEVHRNLRWVNRVPSVCTTLASQRFQRETGLELIDRQGPPSGFGTRAEFTYRLSAVVKETETKRAPTLNDLYGLFSGMFPEPGGGEAWLRKERESLEFRRTQVDEERS